MSSTADHKALASQAHTQLIEEVRNVSAILNAEFPGVQRAHLDEANKLVAQFGPLAQSLNKLHGANAQNELGGVVKTLGLNQAHTVDTARKTVASTLSDALKSAKNSSAYKTLSKAFHAASESADASSTGMRPFEKAAMVEEIKVNVGATYEALEEVQQSRRKSMYKAAQKNRGLVSRKLFESAEHLDEYLSRQSVGGKLGIAASGVVLGGMLMQTGGTWLSQGLNGKETVYSHLQDNSIMVTSRPMTTSKRVAEVLGGAAAGLTGAATEIGGIFAGYRAFIG